MLVISRKPGEIVNIGDGIKVQVVEVRGNQVRIGIEAPRDTAIVRGKLRNHRESVSNRVPAEEKSVTT